MTKDAVTSGTPDQNTSIDIQGIINQLFDGGDVTAVTFDHSGAFQFNNNNDVIGMGFDLPQEQIDFFNDIFVNGNIAKLGGTFKIDHPLDPYNKYLYHSFVESPDMMNIYNGNIITDNNGEATIELPDYFEALNKDFRYQLTVIGSFAQAIVHQKVQNNQFIIKTSEPNIEVSWQVTGVRNDTYAKHHRVQPEVSKEGEAIGKLLFEPGKKKELPAEVKAMFEERMARRKK